MEQKLLRTFKEGRNILLFLLALLCGTTARAQEPDFKAYPLNVFTSPGTALVIDIPHENELGTCTPASIWVSVTTAPTHGTATVLADHTIRYTPTAGFYGQDSLRYSMACTTTQSAWVYINVSNNAFDMIKAGCVLPQLPFTFSIQEFQSSDALYSPYQTPLAGDVDQIADGRPEIFVTEFDLGTNPLTSQPIASGASAARPAHKIAIFKYNGTSLTKWKTIQTVEWFRWDGNNYSIARVPIGGTPTALVVVLEADGYLRAYNPNLTGAALNTPVWTSDAQLTTSVSLGCKVTFADLNNDGIPEILCLGRVLNAATGNLLATITANYPDYWSAADLFNNGKIYAVAYGSIYDVTITNTTGTAGNTATLVRTMTPPTFNPGDPDYTGVADWTAPQYGNTCLADMDRDGKLDIITNTGSGTNVVVYVSDAATGAVKAKKVVSSNGAGRTPIPLIGDIDGDGNLDMVFVTGGPTSASGDDILFAFTYKPSNPLNTRLSTLWQEPINDGSAQTSLSLFDFDQNGSAELVYRDERDLRIMDGTTHTDLVSFPSRSGTGIEYPIVVDADNDGQAEIIIVGSIEDTSETNPPIDWSDPNASHYARGHVRIFKSNDPSSPWAPARKVWNQFIYNPTFVNADLTIPSRPMPMAAYFVDKNGVRRQPFNNLLQQETQLSNEGKMFRFGPDLELDVNSYTITTTPSNPTVSFTVRNIGDAVFTGPITILVQEFNTATNAFVNRTALNWNEAGNLNAGAAKVITHTVTGFTGNSANLRFVLNNNGSGFIATKPECKYSNNYSLESYSVAPARACKGDVGYIQALPNNSSYTYYWYTTDPSVGSPTPVYTGNPCPVTQIGTTAAETRYLKIDNGIFMLPQVWTGKSYLIPDTLVWNGSADNNYNNATNWTYPGTISYSGDAATYKFPGSCTNVTIVSPGSMSSIRYPNLDSSITEYTPMKASDAACNNIHFLGGSEIARTDSLHYVKAYVDLGVTANRWYMISAPLQNMYTGDYYVTNPNPITDGFIYDPMFFNRPNPQTSQTATYAWTGRFNTSDISLAAGQGMAIWYNKIGTEYTNHDAVTVHFPKNDTRYYYYRLNGTIDPNKAPTGTLTRTNRHRFIYEPLAASGNVTLATSACPAANQPLLAGNPFMAHLDMNTFLTANNTQIWQGYKLASGVGGSDGVMNNFVSYLKVGETWYNTDPTTALTSAPRVAPMQSVILVSKVANPTVVANIKQTVTSTLASEMLRSAGVSEDPVIHSLQIMASRGEELSKAIVLYRTDADNTYNPDEDSYQLFLDKESAIAANQEAYDNGEFACPECMDEPLVVYTRSSDGYALDINSIGSLDEVVPLAIRTSLTGEITLAFEGFNDFDRRKVLLHDTKAPAVIDLTMQSSYTFDKNENDTYLEGRFYLSFYNAPTGFTTPEQGNVTVNGSNRSIEIVSKDGSPLRTVKITDAQGRTLINEVHLSTAAIRYPVTTSGIYIVKVSDDRGSIVRKIVVR
ncbi:MAG: FG-GAP-like repeat-containing protein [Dysgonamonadaceae bacterium]|jgi:hypothetical protein|nr:FG-GAP-like repeat-containing protein [Dysgonamonadaceae bacterium]